MLRQQGPGKLQGDQVREGCPHQTVFEDLEQWCRLRFNVKNVAICELKRHQPEW